MKDIIITIGVIGSIASIVGLLIQSSTWKERIMHSVYIFIVTILASGFIYYQNSFEEVKKIEKQASYLVQQGYGYSNGSKRGFILATLAFLEKNKKHYPDTYRRASKLALNIDILSSKEDNQVKTLHQGWKLDDVAAAMKKLLEGLGGLTN